MNEKIILVAETGSDLTPQQAQENGIYLVPMHVTMGDQTLDDGSFPPEEVCAYYQKTGTVPKTSASGPFDFKTVFDRLHEQFPDKKILHLAYSAVTTASYHNALLEGEHRDYVTSIDTKHVSVGQAAVVLHAARPSCCASSRAARWRSWQSRCWKTPRAPACALSRRIWTICARAAG